MCLERSQFSGFQSKKNYKKSQIETMQKAHEQPNSEIAE